MSMVLENRKPNPGEYASLTLGSYDPKKCCAHLITTELSFCNMEAYAARKVNYEVKQVSKF